MDMDYVQDNLLSALYNDRDDAGMRLERLEVNNWGAYDGPCYPVFAPNRWNCMIYGNSGSGKTTILDAMITLMVPGNKRMFNKAAGAEKERDRTFDAYIRGIRLQGQEDKDAFKLRDDNTVCNLLAVFSDSYNHVLSIAQVIYMSGGRWTTMYITSDKRMSIEKDLTNYNGMAELRTRLRSQGAKVHDTFTSYGHEIMTQLGIENESALVLWMKACFMKSVDSVDAFVKNNMLETTPLYGKLQAFTDSLKSIRKSNKAMNDLLKRIKVLKEIVSIARTWEDNTALANTKTAQKELVADWVSAMKGQEAASLLTLCEQKLARLNSDIRGYMDRRDTLQQEIDAARTALIQNGGGRQDELTKQLKNLNRLLTQRMAARDVLDKNLAKLQLSSIHNRDEFNRMRQQLPMVKQQMDTESKDLDNEKDVLTVTIHQKSEELKSVSAAVEELKKHPNSNIPLLYVAVRHQMCVELGLSESELPFAGELMQVKALPKSQGWEGALERLLRPFSMTLLVDNKLYKQVSSWVNAFKKSEKSIKIKFMRVSSNVYDTAKRSTDGKTRAYDCISVKEEHVFANWINNYLTKRFDYVCCDNMSAFHNERFAVTKAGLIRKNDDNERVIYGKNRAPEQYVMGYSNKEHLTQFMEQESKLTVELEKATAKKQKLLERKAELKDLDNILYGIQTNNRDFEAVDVETTSADVLRVETELKELEKKDPENKRLKEVIETKTEEMQKVQKNLDTANMDKGKCELDKDRYTKYVTEGKEKEEAIKENDTYSMDSLRALYMDKEQREKWESMKASGFETRYYGLERDITAKLEAEIKLYDGKANEAKGTYKKSADSYIHHPDFSLDDDVRDLTNNIQFRSGFMKLLDKYESDPLLDVAHHRNGEALDINLTTVKSAGLTLATNLRQGVNDYKKRIDTLNETMKSISYGKGKHIYLQYDKSTNDKVRQFDRELSEYNEYLSHVDMTDVVKDEEKKKYFDYRLEKFLRLFDANGDDTKEKWLKFVTDARNWMTFTVCIHDDKTGQEEVYKDTSSRSGGEKECMAYTIIAAALNYKFNLSSVNANEQSFRVLFIDEAFSRCSVDFVKQCMDLFEKFHLQVILLTPSDKSSNYLEYVKGAAAVAMDDETHTAQLKMEYYKEETA